MFADERQFSDLGQEPRRRVNPVGLPTIDVAGFPVLDARPEDIVEAVVSDLSSQQVAFALHIGGLNQVDEPGFQAAMTGAEFVYADGISVAFLARRAGADHIQKSPTTDLGWSLIHEMAKKLDRHVRVSILGSEYQTAVAAAATLSANAPVHIVSVDHGYHSDYSQPLSEISAAKPDLVIVGMGMPREALWVDQNRSSLPESTILTCGGWLGFLAGNERRAPIFLQKIHLEWAFRLFQSPGRLGLRYLQGLVSMFRLLLYKN